MHAQSYIQFISDGSMGARSWGTTTQNGILNKIVDNDYDMTMEWFY